MNPRGAMDRRHRQQQRTHTRKEVVAKIDHILAGEESLGRAGRTLIEVRTDDQGRFTFLEASRPERFL